MSYYFGDWLKEQREIYGLTQEHVAQVCGIKQSTISMLESKGSVTPSVRSMWIITKGLGIPLSELPWDCLDFEWKEEEPGGEHVKERFGLYDLPHAHSVKTFEGKIYNLIGAVGIETESGEVRHITDLYYAAKTVVARSTVLAKRKTVDEELQVVSTQSKRNRRVKRA